MACGRPCGEWCGVSPTHEQANIELTDLFFNNLFNASIVKNLTSNVDEDIKAEDSLI